jgi:hypothetical protein
MNNLSQAPLSAVSGSRKNPLSDQYNAGNIKKRYRKREKNSGESQEKWVKMFV